MSVLSRLHYELTYFSEKEKTTTILLFLNWRLDSSRMAIWCSNNETTEPRAIKSIAVVHFIIVHSGGGDPTELNCGRLSCFSSTFLSSGIFSSKKKTPNRHNPIHFICETCCAIPPVAFSAWFESVKRLRSSIEHIRSVSMISLTMSMIAERAHCGDWVEREKKSWIKQRENIHFLWLHRMNA